MCKVLEALFGKPAESADVLPSQNIKNQKDLTNALAMAKKLKIPISVARYSEKEMGGKPPAEIINGIRIDHEDH